MGDLRAWWLIAFLVVLFSGPLWTLAFGSVSVESSAGVRADYRGERSKNHATGASAQFLGDLAAIILFVTQADPCAIIRDPRIMST